jgi:hypothetical protein
VGGDKPRRYKPILALFKITVTGGPARSQITQLMFDVIELLSFHGSFEICQMIQILVHGFLPLRLREISHPL